MPALSLLVLVLLVACDSGTDVVFEPSEPPVPCLAPTSVCSERVRIGPDRYLPLFRTHPLSSGDPEVTRAVIVVHGTNRNADDYFESGVLAAGDAGGTGTTVVVSPHFQTSEDGPRADEPFWSSGGWKRGHLSSSSGPSPRVSSYAAIDSIVARLSERSLFPALEEIVVTGHSAGGQVVHRYAATSRMEESLAGVAVRYVVANPSTYLYVRPERAAPDGAFVRPDATVCADFDDWHYGLEDRNSYASRFPADTLRAQLVRRDVRILIGDADSLSASLDTTCGANLQGEYRFARGQTLVRFMDSFFPDHRHTEMVVPGVGHSNRSMWLSPVGLQSLFGS